MMKRMAVLVLVLLALIVGNAAAEDAAVRAGALARLPIREVTVFKDGHAFVLHEGEMPTDPAGCALMDALPPRR